jgi:hypothetical protein
MPWMACCQLPANHKRGPRVIFALLGPLRYSFFKHREIGSPRQGFTAAVRLMMVVIVPLGPFDTDAQIAQTVSDAAHLPSSYGLRRWICSTLFGLSSVAGLRVSEALGIDDKDVDADHTVLSINRSKNGRSRFLALSRRPCRMDSQLCLGLTKAYCRCAVSKLAPRPLVDDFEPSQ